MYVAVGTLLSGHFDGHPDADIPQTSHFILVYVTVAVVVVEVVDHVDEEQDVVHRAEFYSNEGRRRPAPPSITMPS